MTRVGMCSLCSGSVMGVRGAWMSVNPPPPDTCSSCGAVAAGQDDVIRMVPRAPRSRTWTTTHTNAPHAVTGETR